MPRTETHVCPWWLAYTFDNWLRRLLHPPGQILAPYLKPGMTAADFGCGMGVFSLGMARLVGPTGRVIAIDVQQKMLDIVARRARQQGIATIVQPRLATPEDPGLAEEIDFALAFWMFHEVPDPRSCAAHIGEHLAPGGKFLVAEPSFFHVSPHGFDAEVDAVEAAGLVQIAAPEIRLSRAALFEKH